MRRSRRRVKRRPVVMLLLLLLCKWKKGTCNHGARDSYGMTRGRGRGSAIQSNTMTPRKMVCLMVLLIWSSPCLRLNMNLNFLRELRVLFYDSVAESS